MTYKSEMSTNDTSIVKSRACLAVHAVVPVRERMVVYPRTGKFIDEINHGDSKGLVRHGGCRPELPICQNAVSGPRSWK